MLTIHIPATELFNNSDQTFIYIKETTLCMEHSLVSISKWESKYHKPFISDTPKTDEELLYYLECMTITQNIDPVTYKALTRNDLQKINDYIGDSHTATTINNSKKTKPGEGKAKSVVTSELIYYWMIANQIPPEYQKWHLNRLLTLIQVCDVENSSGQKGSKMSNKEILSSNAALNAARRKKLGTRG